MRKVELPLAKGRRRDSKKPFLMVKKDGMILEQCSLRQRETEGFEKK